MGLGRTARGRSFVYHAGTAAMVQPTPKRPFYKVVGTMKGGIIGAKLASPWVSHGDEMMTQT